MINDSYKRFFLTLANENRLKIIRFLVRNGSSNVSQIVRGVSLEQTAVSHNLKRLLACHFVSLRQSGRERVYVLNSETIKPLLKLIDMHSKRYCTRCHLKQ